MAWATAAGNRLLAWDDPDYPRAFLELTDPPIVLFCKGNASLLNAPSLAMVGSRNASPAGLRTAEEFAESFTASGLNVVSGLALGIDAAAHRGALLGGDNSVASTIAIVGTGIDRVYPPRNRDLAHQIAQRGAIISEFALETPPLKNNFPRRNRLISGISEGVLVVEAAIGSGSLITARCAAEQGKEVFAIPGSIHSPFSKGCHRLIKDGAKLVESAQDVREELKYPEPVRVRSTTRSSAASTADAEERHLLDALGYDPVSPDEVSASTGWAIDRVLRSLLQLELSGSVIQSAGGKVQRVS